MKISIPCLSAVKTAGGIRYYWKPTPAMRRSGWKSIALGRDFEAAVTAAKKRNEEVETWRNGGAKPAEVKKIIKRQSFSALILDYKKSDNFLARAESTKREYLSCLRALERWAGNQPIDWITRARVQVLKKFLLTPAEPGGPLRYARCRNVMAVLYNVMQVAVDDDRLAANPAAKAGVAGGPARDRIASEEEVAALVAAAERLDRPSMATAILMGVSFGQRQGDLLKASWSQWRSGRLRLRQGKTRVWVEVKAVETLRVRLTASWADYLRAHEVPDAAALILTNENTGEQWNARVFNRVWRDVKAEAMNPTQKPSAPRVEPCPDLDDLEYRDLRRTAVVRLAEAGCTLAEITAITGHKIERAKKILEVYMPRTTPMADAAIARLEAHQASKAEPKEQKA